MKRGRKVGEVGDSEVSEEGERMGRREVRYSGEWEEGMGGGKGAEVGAGGTGGLSWVVYQS